MASMAKEETTEEVISIGLKYAKDDLIVGVEGGGTSFAVCISRLIDSVESSSGTRQHGWPINPDKVVLDMEILLEEEFPTSDDPKETLVRISNFLIFHRPVKGSYSSLGIACFGPVGLNASSADYGTILPTTPKANWRNVNVLAPILEACGNCYHKFDTDVNAPAMAEYMLCQQQQNHPARPSISSLAYVTVGTGVGVGLIINCRPVHGMMHPEGGQIHVPPMEGDTFQEGYSWGEKCPYRGKHTVEAIASSVALVERLEAMQKEDDAVHMVKPSTSSESSNKRASILKDLEDTHPIWSHAAFALANLCVTLILLNSIEKIVLGGGIVQRGEVLLHQVRSNTLMLLNGYIDTEALRNINEFITTSRFGNKAGLVGALVLGKLALEGGRNKEDHSATQRKGEVMDAEYRNIPAAGSINENNIFWKGFAVGYRSGLAVGVYATAVICLVLFGLTSRNKGGNQYPARLRI